MTGLIWLIQVVHYPSFRFAPAENFDQFHLFHSNRITWIVLPMMSLELLTALFLAYRLHGLWLLNFGFVILIWLLTVLVSVPLHKKLTNLKNDDTIKSLVRTNWLRTAAWTLKSLLLIYLGAS